MAILVTFKWAEEDKFTRTGDKALIEINAKKVDNPWELEKLLFKNLDEFKQEEELEIDRDSYRTLRFKFGDLARDLALATVHSKATYVSFSLKNPEKLKKDIRKWKLVGGEWSTEIINLIESYELTKRLQNTPPNILTTEKFVEEAREALKGLEGIEIKEIKGDDLKKERLELIRAVGKASINEPRLLLINYSAGIGNPISLVGKGVCYDSGGLNIKTGSYMSSMKFDMTGGAVSLGVIRALAKNKGKQNVTVAIPLVENSVDNNAYRPDDVIICRNGMSIEIDNTDAEGRLVLADAIAYSVEVYEPRELITIATLTGSIGYALGSKYGGAWTSSLQQWNDIHDASIKSGEWIWRMPLDDYYLKALEKTRVADIKNSAKTGAGGCNRAARFLKEFTGNVAYIHLDIANIDHCESTGEPKAPLLKTLYFYLFGD